MKFEVLVVTLVSLLAMSSIAFAQYCTPGFQSSYQCSGNWQQQLYINPDCSPYWSNAQYCSNGCFNGYCSGASVQNTACSISASLTTPSTTQSGDLASTTILFTNTGGTGGTVNVYAYLCRADGSNCANIQCSSNSVYVPANSVAYDVCSTRNYYGYYPYPYSNVNPNYNPNYYPNYPYNANQNNQYLYYPGNFRIRVDLSGCNIGTSVYTSIFQIQPYQSCTPGNTNNYQCSRNVRQVQYQNSDCSTTWTTLETCPNGCLNGACLSATSSATSAPSVSTVTTTVTQAAQYNIPDLGTIVLILAVIVLLIIFIRLISEGWEGRQSKSYADEKWRFSGRFSDLGKYFTRFSSRKSDVC